MSGTRLIFSLGDREGGVERFDINLESLPHLLIGGAQGQGKTVLLNNIIRQLTKKYAPEVVKLDLFDSSYVEFLSYNNVPHLLQPVITSPDKFVMELERLETEVEKRLKTFASAMCRNLFDYNSREVRESDAEPQTFPYIVVIADDVSEVMAEYGERATKSIRRLIARARAAGIHLILGTRCMDATTLRGLSVNMIPARIAFQTWSAADSVALIGREDATNLLHPGEFIYRRGVEVPIRGRTLYETSQSE